MLRIARNYASGTTGGRVFTSNQGLALLREKLTFGIPVTIDVLTRFDDPKSEAHFIVVTGISTDPVSMDVTIYFNNPLTGQPESSPWAGKAGVWNAWQHNGDPGGSGWWLVITPPR